MPVALSLYRSLKVSVSLARLFGTQNLLPFCGHFSLRDVNARGGCVGICASVCAVCVYMHSQTETATQRCNGLLFGVPHQTCQAPKLLISCGYLGWCGRAKLEESDFWRQLLARRTVSSAFKILDNHSNYKESQRLKMHLVPYSLLALNPAPR